MIRNALRRGWSLWKAHLADSIAYILIVAAIMLMPLVPMLCLVSKTAWVKWCALIGVPMFLLLVLPMRRNAAAVLRGVVRGECAMNDASLISCAGYRAKLLHGLKLTGLLLLWAIPGIAATVYAYVMYTGGADAITIVMAISKLGGNDVVRGVYLLLGIYAATWLPLMVGSMLHSGARHAFAAGSKALLKGRRKGHCAVWLVSLLVAVPFIAVAAVILGTQLPPVLKMVKVFQFSGLGSALKTMGLLLLADFVVLLLPLVPLRHLMLAAYDHGEKAGEA